LSAGALPQTPLGELTALPRPYSWIVGGLLLRGRGRGKGGGYRREGRKGKRGTGEKRDGEGGSGSAPLKLKLGPQNYFSGAGAVSWWFL